MLGPEGHVYDPLLSPTSIRVLLLAPGRLEDDIFCFLFPCDLDKDYAIDPSVPRPFESLCVAVASGLGSGDETKQFMLPLDSYINEVEAERDKKPHPDTGFEPAHPRKNEAVQNFDGIDQTAQKASESQGEISGQLKPISTASSTRHRIQQTGKNAVSEPDEHTVESAVGEERQLDNNNNNNKAEGDDSKEQSNEEPNEDMWDLMQLTRLTLADGALNDHVLRHPFQRYTALSYVWGSIETPACINVNGERNFWVTRNLFESLKCLRQSNTARALWIDAICINQDDPKEKKVQIGLMRRVYRQAQKVIAYVPQTREDTESLNILIRKILRADMQCRKVIDSGAILEQQNSVEGSDVHEQDKREQVQERSASTPDAPGVQIQMLPLKPTGTCIEDYDVPAEEDPAWGAWRRFFASPYFRRIWILQEYALAQDLYFQFGQAQGKADFIFLAMDCISHRSRMLNANYLGRGENSELTRAAVLGWTGLKQMTLERVLTQNRVHNNNKIKNQRLIDKLDKGMLFDATDPRDKIYALLGLVSDAEQFTDLVSYEPSDTYTKIYKQFAKALIEKGYLVQVLHMACRTPTSPQLPSWVPDWSTPTLTLLIGTVPQEKGFQAGGNKSPVSHHFSQQNQDQLILSGYTFSTIAFKTSAFVPHSQSAPVVAGTGRLQDFFETLLAVLSELSTYLAQNLAASVMDIFHILTMQLRRVESANRHDSNDNDIFRDLQLFRTLLARTFQYSQIDNRAEHKVEFSAMPEEDKELMHKVFSNTAGRSFCVTKDEGRIGLVPVGAQVGDTLATFDGAPVPFVLREATVSAAETGEAYSIIGDAYVIGIMQGELVQRYKDPGKQIILI